jgi:hypothetical protein
MQLPPAEASPQTAQRIPAGRTAANDATRQAEKVEPPAAATPKATTADVLQQSDELLSLAQQVHTDTQRATQGVISRDLKDKLKRIEKLSKRLRDELNL